MRERVHVIGVNRVVLVGKVSEGDDRTRSSGRSTSAQNRPFNAIPRNSVTRTCPRPLGKYHTLRNIASPRVPFAESRESRCHSWCDVHGRRQVSIQVNFKSPLTIH